MTIRPGRPSATWTALAAGLALATQCLAPAGAAPRAPETSQPAASISTKTAAERYGALPVHFEPNVGQFDGRAEFVARGGGYTLFLSPDGSVLVPEKLAQSRSVAEAEAAVVRTRLVGASSRSTGEGVGELPGVTNYFIGNDPSRWRTGIVSYAAVRYGEVYPGIDLLYYGNGRDVEYDFVVAPGADPSAIRMRIDGADRIRVDEAGDLVLEVSGGGEFRQRAPVIYQEGPGGRERVAGGYAVHGDVVTFEVGAYDPAHPLVVDPVIAYSRTLATDFHGAYDIAVGADGSAYVTGFIGDLASNTDVFVRKLDPTGSSLVYSTFFGGGAIDSHSEIAVGADGSAYVTGYTTSGNFPTASPFQANLRGALDAFVTKLSPSGTSIVYSTYLGGGSQDYGGEIAVGSDGSAYISGYTESTNFPTASPLQANNAGGMDLFVTKLSPSGSSLVYSTYLGGSGSDGKSVAVGYDVDSGSAGGSIAVGADGSIYVAGATNSTDFPTAAPLQATYGGGLGDAFVAKIAASGSSLAYSTYLGGSSGDGAVGIAVGLDGSVYVTGNTASTNFPTAAPVQASLAGQVDAFVTKLSPSGSTLVYSTYLGGVEGNGFAPSTGIAVGADGSAYVAGITSAPDFPTVAAVQPSLVGLSDAFVTKLSASGDSLVYSTYLNGVTDYTEDTDSSIAIDGAGSAYVAGTSLLLTDDLKGFVAKITLGTSTTAGVYVPATGAWFLRNANTAGAADLQFAFGVGGAGYVPLSGDWNADTIDTVGLYQPQTGVFFLKNTSANGPADLTFTFGVGGLGYVPVTGDWDGDGVETIGLYRPQTGVFFLKNANANGPADVTFGFGVGGAGYVPLAGDWDGDGVDTVGLYEPATSTFFLTNANAPGPADVTFSFGIDGLGYVPVTGDWDGDGSDTVALYRPATAVFFLRNQNLSGAADLTFVYGPPNATPLAGDWDGL